MKCSTNTNELSLCGGTLLMLLAILNTQIALSQVQPPPPPSVGTNQPFTTAPRSEVNPPAVVTTPQSLPTGSPASWEALQPVGTPSSTQRVDLALTLPLRDPGALAAQIEQIYDPMSPAYRRYFTPEQFRERFSPTEEDYQAVIAFAQAANLTLTATHLSRTLLSLAGSVADVEKLFHVNMLLYQQPSGAGTFLAPDRPPSIDLAVPLSGVLGLDNSSGSEAQPRRKGLPPLCGGNEGGSGRPGVRQAFL